MSGNHERYKQLLKQYVEGLRWLKNNEQDRDEFTRMVVEPMDALWATFTDEEKEYWNRVKHVIDLFDGTIVEEKPKRTRRWRSYSQQF